jgi:predicted ATPase
VNKWFQAHLDGAGIALDQAAFAFQLTETRGNIPVNLVESGRGVHSALPVVTLLYAIVNARRDPPLILIEEPEAHLHPSAHGAMTDLIIDCTRRCQVIIETHSENFILRLRRRIAEKRLRPENVGLYYLNESHQLHQIKLDESGGTTDWPTGIFESDIEEARAIVEVKITAMHELGESK